GGPLILFFPPCCFETAILEERVRDHRDKRVTWQSGPGSALEVIETEFLFQLLVSLLANPSRLDDARQDAQVHLRRQVGEIVFLLSRYSVFADQPSLVAGQMLLTFVPDPLRRSVGNPHAACSKTSLELSFRPAAPTDGAPSGIGQHVFGCHRQDVRNVPLPGRARSRKGPNSPHIGGVSLEVPRNPDRPSKLASREPLAERRAQPIPGIRQHAAETYTSRDRPVDLRQSRNETRTPAQIARSISAKAISGLVRAVR